METTMFAETDNSQRQHMGLYTTHKKVDNICQEAKNKKRIFTEIHKITDLGFRVIFLLSDLAQTASQYTTVLLRTDGQTTILQT
jgi:hypothetical protein